MKILIASVLFASVALADVGPPPPKCNVPKECVTCGVILSEPDSGTDCRAGALDAGLTKSDCSDRVGTSLSEYYCPAGKAASRGCGCGAVDPLMVVAAFALVPLLRRRR